MSKITIIKLYKVLAAKIGHEAAEDLTLYIEAKVQDKIADNIRELVTKDSMTTSYNALKEEITRNHLEMKEGFKNVEVRMQNLALEMKEGFKNAEARTQHLALEMKEGFKNAEARTQHLAFEMKEGFKIAEVRTENLASETRQEFVKVRSEIAIFRTETKNEFMSVRQEMKKDHVETLKWMFLFWIGQFTAMAGMFYIFLKK